MIARVIEGCVMGAGSLGFGDEYLECRAPGSGP
jgi:hypothetical protein